MICGEKHDYSVFVTLFMQQLTPAWEACAMQVQCVRIQDRTSMSAHVQKATMAMAVSACPSTRARQTWATAYLALHAVCMMVLERCACKHSFALFWAALMHPLLWLRFAIFTILLSSTVSLWVFGGIWEVCWREGLQCKRYVQTRLLP